MKWVMSTRPSAVINDLDLPLRAPSNHWSKTCLSENLCVKLMQALQKEATNTTTAFPSGQLQCILYGRTKVERNCTQLCGAVICFPLKVHEALSFTRHEAPHLRRREPVG